MTAEQFTTTILNNAGWTAVAATTVGIILKPVKNLLMSGLAERGADSGRTKPFCRALDVEAHWQRISTAVEYSLARANDLRDHQAAASGQLQAAEYSLHTLLDELKLVMKPQVASPLRPHVSAPKFVVEVRPALAA